MPGSVEKVEQIELTARGKTIYVDQHIATDEGGQDMVITAGAETGRAN